MNQLTIREQWALTFTLEQYLEFGKSFEKMRFNDTLRIYKHNHNGLLTSSSNCCYTSNSDSLTVEAIELGLRVLFSEKVFTPIEFSQELKERTGVRISSQYLKRYSRGIFAKLNILKTTRRVYE